MNNDSPQLLVFDKSHELVLKIYELTKEFPNDEQFSLTSQIKRAAISIPSNIAEGKARGSDKDYRRFLFMARGSLEEMKYQLLLAKDLKYIDETEYRKILLASNTVGKMINGLINKLGS